MGDTTSVDRQIELKTLPSRKLRMKVTVCVIFHGLIDTIVSCLLSPKQTAAQPRVNRVLESEIPA